MWDRGQRAEGLTVGRISCVCELLGRAESVLISDTRPGQDRGLVGECWLALDKGRLVRDGEAMKR